jgi:SAM-dependent methyltransferase
MDIRSYNREAWNRQVEQGNTWTIPFGPAVIAAARQGEVNLLLTPTRYVPRAWYPEKLAGCEILCLASGGGQQGPVLAAAGAKVTVYDNSPRQLQRDREVVEREGLNLRTVEGDMRDLSVFADACFDFIFHPVSNVFVPDIQPVWNECYRVLRPGGTLIAGFNNPILYIFDDNLMDSGKLVVRHKLPYSDLTHLTDEERQQYASQNLPLEFSHSLEEQIGGQLKAGFLLAGLYEDIENETVLSEYLPVYIATRAIKP